jgi:hypothetical protein
MKTRTAIILGLAAAMLLSAAFREEPRLLLFGWAVFLWHNVGIVTVNPVGVATGVVAIALLLALTHYLGRWFCHAVPTGGDAPQRRWRFRWTLSVLLVLVVMFAAGFSAIGLARQLGWLASSGDTIYVQRIGGHWED